MKRNWSKKMILACRRTIATYNKLIETGNKTKWEEYGTIGHCRLCRNATTCEVCPLQHGGALCGNPDKRKALVDAISGTSKTELIEAACDNREYLIRRFREAGVEWREKK